MSRIVQISSTTTFAPSSYTGLTNASFSNNNHPWSDAKKSTSSTDYAQIKFSSTSNEGYVFYLFDTSEIPDNASIKSVKCNIKADISKTNAVSNASIGLYCNDTLKGNTVSITKSWSSSTSPNQLYTGALTLDEIHNAKIKLSGKNGSSSGYLDFYGADFIIEYEYEGVEYEISCINNHGTVTSDLTSTFISQDGQHTVTFNNVDDILYVTIFDNDKSVNDKLIEVSDTSYSYTIENIDEDHVIRIEKTRAVQITIQNNSTLVDRIYPESGTVTKIQEHSNFSIKIYIDDISKISIYDDGIKNNTAELVEEIAETNKTAIPCMYDNTLNENVNFISSRENGYTNESSSTYAKFYCDAYSNTYAYVVFNELLFDSISITNISCSFGIQLNQIDTCYAYLSLLDEKISNKVKVSGSSKQILSISSVNREVKADEISNLRLVIEMNNTSSRLSSNGVYFYGATLKVEYEYVSSQYYLYTSYDCDKNKTILVIDESGGGTNGYVRINNEYVKINNIYKKINGVWSKIDDITTVFEANNLYITNNFSAG